MKDTLSLALGDTSDPLLLDLRVEFVKAIGGDRHLLVGFADPYRHGVVAALAALDRAQGFLRSVVAEEIHRAKAPQLSFTVVPEGGDA